MNQSEVIMKEYIYKNDDSVIIGYIQNLEKKLSKNALKITDSTYFGP